MPPKRNKRYTQKEKKRTEKKQKNTTFKNEVPVSKRKSLEDALSEKLTDELVQKLFDNPGNKYSILIDFCSDNNFVVNTAQLLNDSFIPPKEGYEIYKNNLVIPVDFEKGKLLDIIIKVEEDVIKYATIVKENKKYHQQNCKNVSFPVIYHIPEITTLDDKELLSYTTLAPSVPVEQQSDEGDLNQVPRRPMSYDEEITSQDFMPEQASLNMNDLELEDLEDVTEITPRGVSTPTDVSKELKAKIKEEELKGVSEKPKLKASQDDLSLLNKKSQDKVLRSREEGDVDTTNKQIDFKELARERKEEKEKAKKQQEDTDKLAHEARLRAESKQPKQEDISDDEEMLFEEISDDEAEKEEKEEQEGQQLFKKYTDEIEIISGILQSMMMSGKVSSDKTHRDDYTPALRQLKTKYDALIDIFNKDNTQTIPKNTKDKIINVLTNNHRRLQASRNYDRAGIIPKLKFESNFMEKVQDSLSIMNTLNTYFKTLDESLITNFGNKPQVSYDYTKYVDGGKKTRKNRRKTKRRKTKKRI